MPEQDQEQAPTPVKRPRRAGWIALRGLVLLCLAPVIFAAAAAIMLIERDITAPSWVTQLVQDRAAVVLDGGSLRFGAISMRISRDLRPAIRLIDTSVLDRDGGLVTRIPVIEADLSPRGVILQRSLLVQQVRATGAQVNLRRAADGSLSFALGAGNARRARNMPELLDQIDLFFETPVLDALRSVTATGLIVNFDDARAGRSWTVDDGQLALDLRGGQTQLDAEFALLSGRAEVSTAVMSYTSPRNSRASQLALTITNIEAGDIAAQSPALNWLRDVNAPLSAVLRTELDADGALGPLYATLEIGAGVLQPNPAAEPVSFSDAKASLRYDPVLDLIQFSDITVQSDWGSLRASGDAYLREIEAGLPRALLAQLRLRDVALNPPGLFDTPPLIAAANVDLRLRLDPFVVDIGQAVVIDGPSRLQVQGQIAATDAGWRIGLDSQIDQIAPDRLLDLWPNGFRPGTRNWMTNNVQTGRLTDLRFGLRRAPDGATDVAGNFAFDGTAVSVMPDLPLVTDATGVASLIDHRFVVTVDEGLMTAPEGGEVVMNGSSFAIEDLRQRPSPATLTLHSESSLPSLLALINQPPFGFMDRANLPVTLADGTARSRGIVTMPLSMRPPRDEVRFDFDVDLAGVSSDVLVPGRDLTASAMQLAVNDAGLTIAGPVQLDGVPADAIWTQSFGPPDQASSLLQAEVTLSPDALRAFNIALPPGMITGEGRGQLQVTPRRGAAPQFVLTSDLQGLQIAIPAVSWSKGAGTTGDLRIEGTLGAVPVISRLSISGGGLQAEGRIDLAASGGLERAVFSRLRIGDWLDAPITLRGRGAGQPLGVEIGGGMLDLRRARFGGGGDGGAGGGPVQIVLDRLVVTEGITLTDFRGGFTTMAGFTGQFSALVNGAAAVTGTVAPRNGRSAVRLRSDDAGVVLQAAGFFRTALGGALDLTLLPAGGEGTFDGTVAVRNLRVRDAPSIAALLDAISVVGLIQQLDGQGLSFDTVDAQFRLTPDQVIVTQASAVGPGLGISVDGIYTLASKQFDLQGVVSPFYLVNSIGSFLTRRGEGLIGISFTIAGTSDAPRVGVNPLSVLTPGMFRDIFRRPPPELTQ
ncbi:MULTISPECIES: AsmA-like C-terminal region-containing protein [unclassified Yoonia]|uniref:AsmA-like C-terminal region-containing protein n=1 Tax=unclassified Yoonia TaxID=2629118 RepID=UPI002AFE85C3|nr:MULTISPECIES: AsmA-like C-terminal region-containing protein [unclassified Yoonia]